MKRSELRDLLTRHQLKPGRKLGQHFLADPAILRRIAAAAEVTDGIPVLEVGPGVGVLTRELLRAGGDVTAVELDRALRPLLIEALSDVPGLTGGEPSPAPLAQVDLSVERFGPRLRLVWADAVRLPWERLATDRPGPWRVCSNLPYYITGPFLASLFTGALPWTTAVLLVQAEAAERMQALPGGKVYGAFTCLVAYHAEVERLFSVPRGAFLPPPAVESAVVRLRRRVHPPAQAPREDLLRVVRAAFGQRRKTLRNALAAGLPAERAAVEGALDRAGIDGERRAETLSLHEFDRIALAYLRGRGAGG